MAGMMPFNPSYQSLPTGGYVYNGLSGEPQDATSAQTLQQAMQEWFSANPQYASDAGQSGANLTGQPANLTDQQVAATQSLTQPQNPAIAGGYNPLQPAYLGTPPTLNATTAQGQTYDPTGYNAQGLSPQLMQSLGFGSTLGALQNSVAPQYNQQDQQMMQMLAASGIAPGSTAGTTAFNNLAQQQLAGISPAMASAIQNSQGNQLNAGQFNASTGNTAGQFNAGAANTAGQYNAGNLQQAGQFNANAQNTASGQNLSNYLNQQLYNTNAQNTAGTNYFNAATGAYNNNANAFNALNQQGLSGAGSLAGQTASGGNSMANTQQGNFGVYQSQPINYGAFAGSPTQSTPAAPQFGNPYSGSTPYYGELQSNAQ